MDAYDPENCITLLVAKPPCYDAERQGSKSAGEIGLQALNCAKRGYDITSERPHLREIVDVIKERTYRMKNPLLTENMVAGYGGFVPHQHEQLGKTYVEGCIRSIGKMETGNTAQDKAPSEEKDEEEERKKRKEEHKMDKKALAEAIVNKRNMVQELLRDEYNQKMQSRSNHSPYERDNDDPLKSYIPGYMGFVPRTDNKFGTFSAMTHTAINEFTDDLRKQQKPIC